MASLPTSDAELAELLDYSDDELSIFQDRAAVAEGGLYEFGRLVFEKVEGRKLLDSWHLRLLCRHLEAVSRAEITRLVINVPPGTGKSSWTCVIYPAWDWAMRPWRRWMCTSHDDGLVLRDARRTRAIVQSQWFQDRWGGDDGCVIDSTLSAAAKAGEYWTTAGGLRFSTSVGAKGTGWHAHIQMVDDPHKAGDPADVTPAALEKVRVWWDEKMSSRRMPGSSFARVVIMQRLDEKDLAATCIKRGYHLLCLPMHYDEEHPHLDEEDERRPGMPHEGEDLLCPALKDEEAVREEGEELGPYGRPAQHQQLPVARGGGIFKTDWFVNFWKELPEQGFDIQSWDHSFGTLGDTSSGVAGQFWRRSGGGFYLVDRFNERCTYPVMKRNLILFSAKHRSALTKYVESAAAGKVIGQDLEKVLPGIVPVTVGAHTGGKLARAQSITGACEAGNVWLPHPTEARLYGRAHPCPWVWDFIALICAFRGLPADISDDVDAMSQAITKLTDDSALFDEAMKRISEEG